jgi:hypothetical protein
MSKQLSDEQARNKQNAELHDGREKEKEEKAKKHYVQMIRWDCLICHQQVGIGEDKEGKKFVMCECMVYPADEFSKHWQIIAPIWDFDKFCEMIDSLEEFWAVSALWVKKDAQIPDEFINLQAREDFIKPYQEAHSEWMREHPIMIYECPDCEGGCNGDPYDIDAEEPVVSKPESVDKPSKRKYQQVELAL